VHLIAKRVVSSISMDASEFRTVFTGVRPARIAVLVDQDDSDWQDTCRRVIEYLSSIWGGKNSLIIPTNWSQIDERDWQLLEAFDPDYICDYHKTGLDLKITSPQRYEDLLQSKLNALPCDDSSRELYRESLDEDFFRSPFKTLGSPQNLACN